MTPFERAFNYLILNETDQYTDSPADSGGPTKYGITLRAYANFLKIPLTPDVIKNLTPNDAKNFYFCVYWQPMCLDKISHIGTQIALFDTSVLYGFSTTVLIAQKTASICGATLKLDGLLGDKTIEAINLVKQEDFIKTFHVQILARINTVVSVNPKNQKFIKGWTARANKLLTFA